MSDDEQFNTQFLHHVFNDGYRFADIEVSGRIQASLFQDRQSTIELPVHLIPLFGNLFVRIKVQRRPKVAYDRRSGFIDHGQQMDFGR